METIINLVNSGRVASVTFVKNTVIIKGNNGVSHRYSWEYFEKNIMPKLESPSK